MPGYQAAWCQDVKNSGFQDVKISGFQEVRMSRWQNVRIPRRIKKLIWV